jgi:IgA-specific serine endopeptidase
VSERWEDGFDSWTPRRRDNASEDTGVDLDRETLLRLARELAEQRRAEQAHGDDEFERLKESLRERAAAVAERERELTELQQRLGGRPAKRDAAAETIAARERATYERAQALEARERELQERAAQLEAETARLAEREQELAGRLDEAERRAEQAAAERRLAAAERERLEEREHAAREVEKELAALRVELERKRPAAVLPPGERADELAKLEARLDARERELALMRQRLDAERNALRERERVLRRREIAEVRQSFEPPLAPPSFSDGLASLARERSR